MTIEGSARGKLADGTILTAKYKGQEYRALVIAQLNDHALYRLQDGREFKSPSAAGSAVMNGIACNGWRFWSVAPEGTPFYRTADEAIAEPRHAPADVEPEADEASAPTPISRKRTCEVCGAEVDGRGMKGHLAKHERAGDFIVAPAAGK